MILVNGEILQRRDTTESWEYTNPILPDGQLGWEYDIYGNPIGVKMGNGSSHWDDLPYWFQNSSATEAPFLLVAGSTVNPLVINLASYPLFTKNAMFIYKIGTAPNYTRFEDATISETATGFSIFGHDDGSGKFAEDGVIIMKA